MNKPYSEQQFGDFFIRTFSIDIVDKELEWHFDLKDRYVEIIKSSGWKVQIDNELPKTLVDGQVLFIEKNKWHRIIKGFGEFIVKIKE